MSVAAQPLTPDDRPLSRWRLPTIAVGMLLGFAGLVTITWLSYRNSPPVPVRVVDEHGATVFSGDAHAALMGVFAMLAIALMAFVLGRTCDEARWPGIRKTIRIAFWGTSIGLAMMVATSLFPNGVLQVWDVLQNGHGHARSLAYVAGDRSRLLEWLRIPGDVVFIVFGAVPLVVAALKACVNLRATPGRTVPARPEPVASSERAQWPGPPPPPKAARPSRRSRGAWPKAALCVTERTGRPKRGTVS
jgi:nitric oxide reductase large subunit